MKMLAVPLHHQIDNHRPEVLSAAAMQCRQQSNLKLTRTTKSSYPHHHLASYADHVAGAGHAHRCHAADRKSNQPASILHQKRHLNCALSSPTTANNGNNRRSLECSMSKKTLIALSSRLSPSRSTAPQQQVLTTPAQQTPPTKQPTYPQNQSSSSSSTSSSSSLSSTTVCLLSPIILLKLIILLILSSFILNVCAANKDQQEPTRAAAAAAAAADGRHLLLAPPITDTRIASIDEQLATLDATIHHHHNHHVDRHHDSNLSRRSRSSSSSSSSGTNQPATNNSECYRLFQLFSWLQTAYPALTNHLFALATLPADANQQQGARVSQLISSITLMLDEANQLAATRKHSTPDSPHAGTSATKSKAWLRVLQNPAYAKIVHQFRAQQKAQRQSAASHQLPVLQQATNERPGEPDDGSNSHHFGRLVHYPHELSSTEVGTQTLEKLHELGRENQRWPSELEAELESNKIPPPESAGGDGPPWPRPVDSSEAARARFVYGNVLLRPEPISQVDSAELGGGQQSGGRNSLEKLRKLGSSAGNQVDHQLSEPNESFGRVLVSPPNFPDTQRQQQQQQHQQQHQSNNAGQVGSDRWAGSGKSTLQKLRQQLDPRQFELISSETGTSPVVNTSGDARVSTPDDQAGQRTETSSAIVASDANLGGDPSDAEFEGQWHSGPIAQIELRPIREEGHRGAQSATSTGSPVERVFLAD